MYARRLFYRQVYSSSLLSHPPSALPCESHPGVRVSGLCADQRSLRDTTAAMAFRMSAATSTTSTARLAARAAPFAASAPARPMAARPATARQALQVAAGMKAGVGVFGEKAGMTQVFTEDGKVLPVTVISVANGNVVTMVRRPSQIAPPARARGSLRALQADPRFV